MDMALKAERMGIGGLLILTALAATAFAFSILGFEAGSASRDAQVQATDTRLQNVLDQNAQLTKHAYTLAIENRRLVVSRTKLRLADQMQIKALERELEKMVESTRKQNHDGA